MIEDRDYMREPEYREPMFRRFRWSWTWILIAVYAVVFIAEYALGSSPAANSFFINKLTLSVPGLAHGYLWQFLTYQFLHANLPHLFFNCLAIFFLGRELEPVLGARRFLTLVFSSGIIGGVFQILVSVIWPALFHGGVVGASAGVFGLVAAYAIMFPEREWTMLVFFVIPVTVKAKNFLIFSAVLAAAGLVFSEMILQNMAHAAHLGGMAMGWFYVKKILPGFSRAAAAGEAGEKSESGDTTEFTTREVDAILDKMSAGKKLTVKERAILESASKKMNRP